MDLALSILHVAVGVVLLYVGAEGLVRGSADLALRFGLSPLVVGLTVVALGTSSPELVVTMEAAMKGNGDIAVGSVVGSNISNLALILGATVALRPLAIRKELVSLDLPVVIACSLMLVAMLLDGRLDRWEGIILVVGLGAFLLFNGWRAPEGKAALVSGPIRLTPRPRQGLPWLAMLFVAAGLALLVFGGDMLLGGAIAAAEIIGVSQAVIGLTLVAVGTSLPELATATVAALKRESDLAVGNLIGSNVLNILGVLGISAIVSPLRSQGVRLADLGVMVAITVLTLILMRIGFRLRRWEGALLLGLYGVYIWHLTQ
ncbi:MAG: calcium/sodium antiporter [Gemmatimonadales bacterium]|jgi:cation:H+ antiporter